MKAVSAAQDAGLESLVGHLADEFRERLARGERPAIEEYAARYPEHEAVLRNLLTTLQLMVWDATSWCH